MQNKEFRNLSLYCTPSARTAQLIPVLHTLSLYFKCVPACTAHPQPVLQVYPSLYCTLSACTSSVSQPVLHTLSLYFKCVPACTAHPQLVLHILYTGCGSTLLKGTWYSSSEEVLMYHLLDKERQKVGRCFGQKLDFGHNVINSAKIM